MKHSVEGRFIAIVSTALLVVVAPLFTLFLTLSSQKASESLKSQIETVLAANAQALGKTLAELDSETMRQTALAVIAEPTVHGVHIHDKFGNVNIVETDINPADFRGLTVMSRPITYLSPHGQTDVGEISVYVKDTGWFAALREMEIAFIAIFVVAVLTLFIAAIIGNRIIVVRPLLRLTAAIEATRRLGSRHHVDWQSNDEMGRLAHSFNEMQTLLEHDERALKRAHEHTTEIYNRTPAMLFSLDRGDMIAAVSDYWLLATGYERGDVVGRPFAELVDPQYQHLFMERRGRFHSDGSPFEVILRFVCKNGRLMDALIVERELDSYDGRNGSLSIMTDVTELKQSELRNHQQAITDHLTGLVNRQGFEAILDARIKEADAAKTPLACVFVDLDRFKSVNDSFGHASGDELLRQFVSRTLPMLREIDTASRLGGDEFAILLTEKDARIAAEELSDRIIELFATPFAIDGSEIRLSASVGLAFYPDHATTAADLLQKSDLAMYARKRDGKNGAQVYTASIMDKTRERAEIESDIHAGLTEDWFEAHFQPIVDISSTKIIGFEALMRLRHPQKGLLSPAAIIKVAEDTGTINGIGNLIIEDAMANLARISQQPGMGDTYLAVNFSPLQFECSLPMRLVSLLDRHNIRPQRLVIEITEAVLMHDNPEIRTILGEIQRLGCRIALDDFGTGYSSLSYMSRFPVDIVKIDQSFVRSLDEDSDVGQKNRMLVEGIAAISHKMNCKVIAEGVETDGQRTVLREIGIDCGQGYHFSKPRQIDDLLAGLEENGTRFKAAKA